MKLKPRLLNACGASPLWPPGARDLVALAAFQHERWQLFRWRLIVTGDDNAGSTGRCSPQFDVVALARYAGSRRTTSSVPFL
jgi:hypothetical protein